MEEQIIKVGLTMELELMMLTLEIMMLTLGIMILTTEIHFEMNTDQLVYLIGKMLLMVVQISMFLIKEAIHQIVFLNVLQRKEIW